MNQEPDSPNPELLAFMAKLGALDGSHLVEIARNLNVITPARGTLLVSPGEVADKCYMIIRGCVRQYVETEDGKELTTGFFTESQAVVSFQSFKNRIPVNHYWVCTEDCCMIVGDAQGESDMYAQYPELEAMTRTWVEMDFGKQQEDFARFIASSPEERYLNLLEIRPELLQRVPQHQIASYLGVTPESLSRIRKRIQKHRK